DTVRARESAALEIGRPMIADDDEPAERCREIDNGNRVEPRSEHQHARYRLEHGIQDVRRAVLHAYRAAGLEDLATAVGEPCERGLALDAIAARSVAARQHDRRTGRSIVAVARDHGRRGAAARAAE